MTSAGRFLAPLVLAMLAGDIAAAEDSSATFPNRPIRMIVPFPAGGPSDIVARLIGQKMSEDWGQPVVIENRAGGNTTIGAVAAARSAPDGYTLFAPMDTTMVMNPLVTSNLPYDPLKDFTPITLLTKNMSLVVVRSDGPRTIKELIARARPIPASSTWAPARSRHAWARFCSPGPPASMSSSFRSRAAPKSVKPCSRGRSISRSTAPARACR